MKKTIEEYLKLINPKNEREVFVASTHLSLVFFETDDNEGVRYLAEDLYNEMISKGYVLQAIIINLRQASLNSVN